jgi:Flp pilus assembly protein TadB
VSKERAHRRAERQAATAQRLELHRQRQATEAVRRRRRARWQALAGRRRPTQSPAGRLGTRRKERRAVIASALLVVVVLTYLMTRSIAMVVGVLLVAAIAVPALAAAFLDRSKR